MVAGNVAKIVHGPGSLIVSPTTSFDTTAFPHGATEVGLVNEVRLTPLGESHHIKDEALGETIEILESGNEWLMQCFLRAWDDDALTKFFPGNRSEGGVTRHGVFAAPGTRNPGQSTSDLTNLVIAIVPENLDDVPGIILYRAIPFWDDATELAWAREDELGLPLQFHCLRNATNHTLKIGRMSDLALT